MTRAISGMAASIAAALILSTGMDISRSHLDEPPRKVKPRTRYRAPEPDHAGHIARAEAKRQRKAAKLRGNDG